MSKVKKKKSKLASLGLIFLFIIGALVLSYPLLSDMWNQYRNMRVAVNYEKTVSDLTTRNYEQMLEKARKYNENHRVNVVTDAFSKKNKVSDSYMELINPGGDGVMGCLEIPKIKLRIAIYHGEGEKVLQTGCGHLEGTSLPVGGEGTHAALAAHRGLPRARLFTDLDQMEKGDVFYITVLNEHLAYEVDQVKVVKPDRTDLLNIVEGKDYVTLVTCTPYGVNSHRLLVRGHRIPWQQQAYEDQNKKTVMSFVLKIFIIGAIVAFFIILIMKVTFGRKAKRA